MCREQEHHEVLQVHQEGRTIQPEKKGKAQRASQQVWFKEGPRGQAEAVDRANAWVRVYMF